MFILLSEIHFWTVRDNVQIQDSDLGGFKYHEKKVSSNTILNVAKRNYTETRGVTWVNSNKRPSRLRDTLKELEELLEHQKLIYQEWCNSVQFQLMFHTGILVTVTIHPHSSDITHIQIEKYLVNKLVQDNLANLIVTNQHAVCSYNENHISLIHFNKPTLKSIPCKWYQLDPKIVNLSLAGPSGRRIERKLSANVSGDMVLCWWRCTRDEVYPWSPVVKDVDRANIHIYSLSSVRLELVCYYRTECDPLCVEFSHTRPNVIHSVEQKISKKGEVSVDCCTYEVVNAKCHRTAVTCIPLETHVCCHSFSPDNRHLVLGCIDASLVLHDIPKGISHLVKAAFIPTLVGWNGCGSILTVANEKCQLQFFESSLSCIKVQLSSEDITPCNILDLGSYFRSQPTLLDIRWHPKSSHHTAPSDYEQSDAMLLLICEKGPISVLKIFGAAKLSADVLIAQYMTFHQTDQAVTLLRSLDWDMTPGICLTGLQKIVNYLLKQNLTPEIEVQLESALASFLAPVRPFSSTIETEFADPVRDLTRRFLYHLLRYGIIDKALRVAIDLEEMDTLMDVHYCARSLGILDIASAALEAAHDLEDDSSSSCSSCTSSSRPESPEPLPICKPKVKFNVPDVPSISSLDLNHLNGDLGIPTYTPPLPQAQSRVQSSPSPSTSKQIPLPYQSALLQSKFDDEGPKKIKVVHFGVV